MLARIAFLILLAFAIVGVIFLLDGIIQILKALLIPENWNHYLSLIGMVVP